MFRYYLQIHVYRLLKLDISITEYRRFLLHTFVFILVGIQLFMVLLITKYFISFHL